MDIKLFLRPLVYWCLFIPVAIINGIVRNFLYAPIIGEQWGHVLSTFIASLLFIFLVFLFYKNNKVKNLKPLQIGFFWLLLTILFEFGFGHYMAGHSWQRLFSDYNIFNGKIWSLFLLVILLSPLFIAKREI